jgi:beta-N-acetylhexosaminidase
MDERAGAAAPPLSLPRRRWAGWHPARGALPWLSGVVLLALGACAWLPSSRALTSPPTPTAGAVPPPTVIMLHREPDPTPPPRTPTPSSVPLPSPAAPSPPADEAPRVDELLARMDMRQKVGQLLMLGFQGTTAASAALLIERYQPGSIILYENTTSPAQTADLTTGLQRLALQTGAGVPLFIAIDHEGGAVQRLQTGVTWFPSQLVLGATHDPRLAAGEGAVVGRELRALGINMNLGPVLDVDTSPPSPIIGAYQRALGADPGLVAQLGTAFVDALQRERVVAVPKHFPGHGRTREDSHLVLPRLLADRAALEHLDLVPFREVLPRASAVMVAHIVVPALDADWPASLSTRVLTQLLRAEWGFQGLIITDDFGGMRAITDNYTPETAAVQAIRAGADIVMVVGDPARQQRTVDGLLAAVQAGQLSVARVDDAVRRVLGVKAAYGLLAPPPPATAAGVGAEEHRGLVRKIAEQAITLVRNPNGQVPASRGVGPTVVVSPWLLPKTGTGTLLGEAVRRRRPSTQEFVFDPQADAALQDRILSAARDAELVVMGTSNAGPWQRELVRQLAARRAPLTVIGFGRPEEVGGLTPAVPYIAAYSPRAELVEAAVAVLFGELPACGRLPVAPESDYPLGSAAQRC